MVHYSPCMAHSETLATPSLPAGTGVWTFSARCTIEAPASQAWRVLSDFSSYPLWNPYTPQIDGRLEVNQTITLHYRPETTGSLSQVPCVVLEVDEAAGRIVWRGCPKGIPAWLLMPEKVHVVKALGESRCSVEIFETQGGPMAYVVKWSMGEKLMKYQQGMCDRLKEYVEGLHENAVYKDAGEHSLSSV